MPCSTLFSASIWTGSKCVAVNCSKSASPAPFTGSSYAFVFTLNKSEEAQTQLTICRPNFERIYLVTNEVDVDTIPKQADDIYIPNLADRYGLGNMAEKL